MATIKSYTDIEQSNVLAKILPLESADMEYIFLKEGNIAIANVPFVKDEFEVENSAFDYIYNRVPCWSLTALLEVLPLGCEIHKQANDDSTYYYIEYISKNKYLLTKRYKNSVDTAYEMILTLNEQKLL